MEIYFPLRPVTDIKQLSNAFTIDSFLQTSYGIKVDSLVDITNPLTQNLRDLFSVNVSLKDMISFSMIFLMPKVSRSFGIRVFAKVIDFLRNFLENLIKQKRSNYENFDHIGKANNFIDLMLEANEEAKLMGSDLIKRNEVEYQINNVDTECIEGKCKYFSTLFLMNSLTFVVIHRYHR